MEKIYLTLASEAVAYIELKRLKEVRKKMEGDPKPSPIDLALGLRKWRTSIRLRCRLLPSRSSISQKRA